MVNRRREAKRFFAVVMLCVVGLFLFFGCAATEPDPADFTKEVPKENLLRVGVSTDAPPLIFKIGDRIMGLEADFAYEFAAFLGKSVRFIEVKWKDQIPALLEGRTDIIMSGMSVTEMREVAIAFSKPYLQIGQAGLVRSENLDRFKTDLKNLKDQFFIVGVVRGTTGEAFALKTFTKARIVSFSDAEKAAEDLRYGTIHMVIQDAPMVYVLASKYEARGLVPLPYFFTEEYLAWGIRKRDTELLRSANEFLEIIRGDGRLDALVQRWIPKYKSRL